MNLFDEIPWNAVATNLRAQADALSGVEGGLLGAGLGAVTTMAAMKAAGQKPTMMALLAGAAIGIAYGAADKRLIRSE